MRLHMPLTDSVASRFTMANIWSATIGWRHGHARLVADGV